MAFSLDQTEKIDCISCLVITPFMNTGKAYATKAFEQSIEPVLAIFAIMAGIWAISMVIQLAVTEKSPQDLLVGFVSIGLVAAFLSQADLFIYWIFDTSLQFLHGLSTLALTEVPYQPITSENPLEGLAASIEHEIRFVISVAIAIIRDASFYNLDLIVGGTGLLAPFFFVLALYLGQLSVAVFRIVAITALGAWLCAFIPFKPLRSMTWGALKTIATSILVMATSTIGIGIMVFVVHQSLQYNPTSESGIDPGKAADFVFSDRYWLILLVGWLGVAYQWEAASIASAIGGVFMNSVGPALFAAGTTTTAAIAALLPFKTMRGVSNLSNDAKNTANVARSIGRGIGATASGIGKGLGAAKDGLNKMEQYWQARGGGQ